MGEVLVKSYTRKKPARKADPFQDMIDARLAGRSISFPPLPEPKHYSRDEANRFTNSWLAGVMRMLAGER